MEWVDARLRNPKVLAEIEARLALKSAPVSGCLGFFTAIPRGMAKGAYRGLFACLLLAIMGAIVWGNLLNDEHLAIRLDTPAMPTNLERTLRATGLWESWSMFAPDPLSYEGWFGLNGIFQNGETYDLRSPLERPHWYYGPSARWGKLEENLMSKEKDDPLFSAWAAYICRENRFKGLKGVQIALYSRATSPPGQPFLPYHTVIMRGGDC
jgi:hypothetical protein